MSENTTVFFLLQFLASCYNEKMNILEVKNLKKNYGSYTAVDDISFTIKKGQVIGFLGPNGAGKTTTIQILCSITLPSSGKISYFGNDFATHRQESLQRINFSSAFNTLQGRITVEQNLLVFADLYQVKNSRKKIQELAESFEISDLLREEYQNLSSGQKTRVNIVKSLLNDPELLLLDEPTASLDPDIADKVVTFIENLRKSKEISILYTSHDMAEVTRICDEVIFINRGKIIAQDTPLGLTKRISSATLQLTFDAEQKKVENFLKKQHCIYTFLKKNIVAIQTEEKKIPGIIFDLANEKVWITDIEVKKPTLDDFFLQQARGGTA